MKEQTNKCNNVAALFCTFSSHFEEVYFDRQRNAPNRQLHISDYKKSQSKIKKQNKIKNNEREMSRERINDKHKINYQTLPKLIQVSKCSLQLCRFQKRYSPKFIIPKHSPKISSVIAGNIPSCIHQHTSWSTSITQPAWRPTAGSDQERCLYISKPYMP